MKRILFALVLALGAGAAYAQLTGASTGVRTVISDLIEWTGTQKFRDDVEIGGALTVAGAQTFTGNQTVTGDLDVTGNINANGASVGVDGNLEVTGTTTLVGGLVSPVPLQAADGLTTPGQVVYGTTTLTEAGGAETMFTVTNATLTGFGGVLEMRVVGADAADAQVRTHSILLSGVNKAGTTTCTESVTDETGSLAALSSGTMTYVFAGTPGANTCVISINIDSSLTLTSASVAWKLSLYGPATVTLP